MNTYGMNTEEAMQRDPGDENDAIGAQAPDYGELANHHYERPAPVKPPPSKVTAADIRLIALPNFLPGSDELVLGSGTRDEALEAYRQHYEAEGKGQVVFDVSEAEVYPAKVRIWLPVLKSIGQMVSYWRGETGRQKRTNELLKRHIDLLTQQAIEAEAQVAAGKARISELEGEAEERQANYDTISRELAEASQNLAASKDFNIKQQLFSARHLAQQRLDIIGGLYREMHGLPWIVRKLWLKRGR